MTNENKSAMNASPIKSWMKVAGGSTKSAFKEYLKQSVMPVTAEMAKDLSESLKKTQAENKQERPKKQSEIFRKFMQNAAVKNMQSVIKNGWKEVKRGNIFMIGATGDDDLGDDLDLGDSSSGNTTFGGDDNAQMMNGYDEIGDRISDQTEATYKAAEVNMNATLMSSSAIIESQEKMSANIVSRLDNISTSLNKIATTQTDEMTKFFKAVTDGLDRMGVGKPDDKPTQIPDDDGVFRKNAMGKSAGLKLNNYKRRVLTNLKEVASQLGGGYGGIVTTVASMGMENLTADQIGMFAATSIMSKVFENNIGKLGRQIESVVADGIPRVIMGLTDLGNSDATSSKFAKMIGKLFGVDLYANLNKPEVKFEGKAIPFDDQTKASIVNVIPKHLSEISEYTKLLAQSISKLDDASMERVRQRASIFDMNDGKYKSREDLTREVFMRYYDTIARELTGSEFGKGIQNIVNTRTSNIKGDTEAANNARNEIRDSYDNVMKQLAMFLYANGNKGVDLRESTWIEQLGEYFKTQKYNQDEITQLLEEIKTVASKDSVVNDMARTRLGIYESGKRAAEDLKNNPNLVDTFIVEDKLSNLDMANAYTDLVGLGERRLRAAGFDRSKSSKTTNTPKPVEVSLNAYTPGRGRGRKYKKPGKRNKDDAAAAPNASLSGSRSNNQNENNTVVYENDYSHEAAEVRRMLGTEGTFSQDSQGDRAKNRVNKLGEAGTRYFKKLTKKVDGSGNELAKAFIHGDTNKILDVGLNAIKDTALLTAGFVGEFVISPAAKFIFGKKNEDGYREGGMLSGVSNKIHDVMQSVAARIDGKEWTDIHGKVHKPDNPEDSILNKAKSTIDKAADKFKEVFSGKKGNTNSDEGSVIDDIRNSSKDLLSDAKKNIDDLLFGEDFAELDDSQKQARIKKAREDIKERTQSGLKGGLAGAGISMIIGSTPVASIIGKTTLRGWLGRSVVGTAIVNPLVGAGIGFTVGFLSKSENFQRFLFGGEFTDKNGNRQWREGLIKKSTQDFIKENKTTIGVGAALGVGTSLFTGSKFGLFGNILGGPVAGAGIGIASALTLKSKAFQTFLFGDEEKGILGIKQQWAKLMGNDKNTPSITKAGLKSAGFASAGAALSVKFGASLAKHGLIPALFSEVGPIGLAAIGMAGGMALAHKDLKKFIFGEDFVNDEGELERKEGIIGKFTNALNVTLVQPLSNTAKSVIRQINYQIAHNVLAPLRIAFYPFAAFGKKLISRINKGVSSIGRKIVNGLDKYFLDPMKLFVRAITKPIARFASIAGTAIKLSTIATGNAIGKALGISGRVMGRFSMTEEERAEWAEQRKKAKAERVKARAELRAKNREDKLANKDRAKILKYTHGDYGSDTSEARRIAERRAGHSIRWKNVKPQDGYYVGEGSEDKNKFDKAIPILSGIREGVTNILQWLKAHLKFKGNGPTVGYASGTKKVPPKTDYVANENSTKGTREVINIPRGNGKGSTVVEGRKGSFKVWNGGGEAVHNGTEEQPIPILVTGYTEQALDQRDGVTVEVAKIDDKAKKTTTEAIDDSEAGIKSTIPQRFKDFSLEFGKSFFGPDWEPKKGGFYDIATSVIGDLAGAIFLPIAGLVKSTMAVAKLTLNTIKLGAKVLTLPFKGAKWLGKKAFSLGKKGINFAKRKIDKYKNGDHIDLKATVSGIASDIGSAAKDKAVTVRGNRRYAKYKKLILSGDEFYKDKFDVYKDENGREHIIAREDVQIDKNIVVHAGEELKDALGAANLFKRTEEGLFNKIKRRAENAVKTGNKESEEVSSTEADNEGETNDKPEIKSPTNKSRIADALTPTNSILNKILDAIRNIGYTGNNIVEETTEESDNKLLPAIADNEIHLPVPYNGKVKRNKIDIIKEKLNGFFKNSPFSTYTKSKEEGSAAVIRHRKEEAEKNALIEVRENENNSLLKRLAENSDDEKNTRKSWFGKNGKLMKMFGIGALIAFGIYKFFGTSGLVKTIKSIFNVTLALLKSVWHTAGDLFYGMDNLTDNNDVFTQIDETNVAESALTSSGGANIAVRSGMAGFEAISKGIKAGVESGSKLNGAKAGFKSLGESVKNGIKGMRPIKTRVKDGAKNLYNKIFKTGEVTAKTKTETAGNYTGKVLAETVAKHMGNANTKLAQYVAKADEAGVKSVSEMLLSSIKTIAERVAGSSSTAVTVVEETTKSSVFKEILDAVKKSAAKILAKMSSKNSIKMITAVITFGTSDLGFATLGALNGLTGAARLFHIDKEDVDTLMVGISAAMGALTNFQVIGPFLDAASSVIADMTGFDLLSEIACLLYRVITAITGGDSSKLDEAREKARKGYDEYKEKTIQEQYETYINANKATLGNDYTYDDFIEDVNNGNLGVKVDSEITYNKKRNKTFFAKIGDAAGAVFKGAGHLGYTFVKNEVGWIETIYVDNTNETIYRKNSGKWRAYKWIGNDQFANLGVIDKDNIPDTAERRTVRQVSLVEKMFGARDGICKIPEDNGWTPWNPDDAIDISGTDEANNELPSDEKNDNTDDGNATLDTDNEDFTAKRDISDLTHASVTKKGLFDWGDDVSRYKNEDSNTLKSLQRQAPLPEDADAAAFATINNDSKMVDVFGNKYSEELANGLSADDLAKKYGKQNLDPFKFDSYDFEGLLTVDDPDELRERLKDYALFIRDIETNEYRNGFFLVHPNQNSFIRFTASGNFFGANYRWTSVLSAWISGMVQARKINNYDELISSLDESGINIDVIDPNDIAKDSDDDSIFDLIGKAFKSMFSAFSTSWRRIMTSEEVDESMEETEENWVDNVVGKKIVRPISEDGSKPTSKNFKAVTYLFYVIDGSKKFFREYNIFQTYTEMQIDVEVVKNWVKNSEAWIVKDETFSYDENGAPDIDTIDPSQIKIYNPVEDDNGIIQLKSEDADDEYTTEERETLADAHKLSFEDYGGPNTSISGKEKDDANAVIAEIARKHIGPAEYLDTGNYIGNFVANSPLGWLARFAATDKGSPSGFADWLTGFVSDTPLGKSIKYNVNTTPEEYNDDMGSNPIQWMLNTLGYGKNVTENHNTTLSEDISGLIESCKDFFKNIRYNKSISDIRETADTTGLGNNYFETTKKDEVKGWNDAFHMFGIGGRGGFGSKPRIFSNKHSEELDNKYNNIKASLQINDSNARSLSKTISDEDSKTSEIYNKLNSKSREEEVRKQLSQMITPTQVLMGMDGTYWVWDRTNTFHRYTYFGQDIQEELSNDEMLALFKNGRYLIKEKPLSYVNNMESTLSGNLSRISSNYNTGISSIGNTVAYASSYISGESSSSNIYSTGGSSTITNSSTSTTSNTSSDLANRIKTGLKNISNAVNGLISKDKDKNNNTKIHTKKGKFERISKGGFGDRINGVPYYSQNDIRWKNSDYSGDNDTATMGDAGCGPAVLSMVDNYYGGNESPMDYARLAQETGYRDSSGTNWDFISSATQAMGLNTNQIENPDTSDIASELSSGQPVILSGTRTLSPNESPYTRSGHYVVATGLNDDGSVNISDPRGKNYSRKFSLDKLASETGSMWGFGGKGGFGKLRKKVKDKLNKKKIGGGRGTFSADQARQIMLKWISAFYQRVHYANVDARNMDAAYAGTGIGQADCSSLQQYLYRRAAGIEINRDTRSQACNKYPVIDRSNGDNKAVPNWSLLKPGDLIYFCRLGSDINDPAHCMCHVEMYIGNTHSLGIGSPSTPGSRLMDVQTQITSGAAATCATPQKYWGTKRIIQDGQTYDMNVPDDSLIRFDTSTYSAVTPTGGGSTSLSGSSDNSTISTTTTSAKSKDFFEVLGSLMGEVGNRYVKGVASGNFDTDFTAAFNEILNGGTTTTSSGGANSGSLGNYTNASTGSYINGGIYNGDYIGSYVKRFESGANGSRNGLKGEHCGNDWGRSWGSYSFIHRYGTALKFLKKYYPDLAANLRYDEGAPDIATGTWSSALSKYISSPDEVSAVWAKALEKDGDQNFFAKEHQYAADNWYLPMLNGLKAGGTNFNPDAHSRAAQELMWAWAICRGGECAGRIEFPDTGIKDNNISVPDLLAKAYRVRLARTKTYDVSGRYTNSGSPDSEYTTLLQLGDTKPLTASASSSTSTTSDKTDKPKKNSKFKTITADDTAKGGFGDAAYKTNLKKEVKKLLNGKDKSIHVSDPKTKAVNLKNLSDIESKVNAREPIVGDMEVTAQEPTSKVVQAGSIPGSNGIKTKDIAAAKGGYGSYYYRGGRGTDTSTRSSTAEVALNKLVTLVETIVNYVSQSNNKLDYLKDIKNQQVVVKEGDKNIAIQNPSGNSDLTSSTASKSIGRVLAEILASG